MSTNTSDSCYNETNHIKVVPVVMYSFIAIIGFILNSIALVVFCSNGRSRSQTIVYMTNLAIADLLLILTLPMRIYYHLGYNLLSQWLCNILGLVLKANMYSSIYLLMSICFDRCLAVTLPMSARVQGLRKKAPLVCFGIWLLTFGASIPIYFSKHINNSTETQRHCFDSLPVFAINPFVVIPTLVLGFGVPLVLMLICSWFLIRAVRRSTVAQTDLVDSSKISKMIITSLLIFVISFVPYHATLLLLSLNRENIPCPMLAAHRHSLMVACFNTVLDPVAYYFTTDTFRKKVDMGVVWRMLPLNSQSSDLNKRTRSPDRQDS
ncbi:lysophosphatidic acid receptor 6 [Cheilinus undulatus]|uniref:lysophosphatidic acid receptor 6 n=1 Tax=Cheilinus undulatus TaxID=241271 RepID=UPI001BD1F467|nr:lysophosphatidic acid receptor 6 [Cheilinus undulatus]